MLVIKSIFERIQFKIVRKECSKIYVEHTSRLSWLGSHISVKNLCENSRSTSVTYDIGNIFLHSLPFPCSEFCSLPLAPLFQRSGVIVLFLDSQCCFFFFFFLPNCPLGATSKIPILSFITLIPQKCLMAQLIFFRISSV